jgi:hypothetical protein
MPFRVFGKEHKSSHGMEWNHQHHQRRKNLLLFGLLFWCSLSVLESALPARSRVSRLLSAGSITSFSSGLRRRRILLRADGGARKREAGGNGGGGEERTTEEDHTGFTLS